VFQGTAASVTSIAGPEPISRIFLVELEVAAVWKGPVARVLSLVTPEDDFSCGTVFVPGEEYVVYATMGDLMEGRLGTILCDRTRILDPLELDFLGAPCRAGEEIAAHEGETCTVEEPDPPASLTPPCSRFLRGDADTSGKVALTDAVVILTELFLGRKGIACADAADANDDGKVELADPVTILGSLFRGEGPLPPPGPEFCEGDPTEDRLDCAGSTPCPIEE
jgi:hypothetical protein